MTSICNRIQAYERLVWNYLSNIFRYNLKSSEIGITNDLIYRIVDFYRGRPLNCEVYSFQSRFESIRGADIDLFIEANNRRGYYYYYMLQAKIMNHRGRYIDIKSWTPNAQFNRLIRNARLENALPLYLLYNGLTINSNNGNPTFGLSILDASRIRNIRRGQIKTGRYPSFRFNQLYLRNMNPFHVLFCNVPTSYTTLNPIAGNSIFTGHPYRRINQIGEQNLVDSEISGGDHDINTIVSSRMSHFAPIRIIVPLE